MTNSQNQASVKAVGSIVVMMATLRDSEDESKPAEAPKSSPPTYELTKKAIPENDQTTKPISPVAFTDWEGETKVTKSKELKKTLYAHGYEMGVVSSEDIILYPVQSKTILIISSE